MDIQRLAEKSKEKKALDEFVGIVYKKSGDVKFRFRKDYEDLFVPANLYREFSNGKNYDGVIAFIIESPHIHEFKIDIEIYPSGRYNARPLNNPSTKKYLKKIVEGPLKEFFCKNMEENQVYLFLIVNSIQYQCSLGEKTSNYRDLLFIENWMDNCRKDFIKRIKEYNPDLFINSCTKGSINRKFLSENFGLVLSEIPYKNVKLAGKETNGILTLQDIVESTLEIKKVINEENYVKYNHPSYFVYQESRNGGNIYYPEAKTILKKEMCYFKKE